jgi:hypothetical protein
VAEDPPTLSEIARRLTKIEDLLTERYLLAQVYYAEKATLMAANEAQRNRIEALERFRSDAIKMLITAVIGILVQGAFLAFQILGGK